MYRRLILLTEPQQGDKRALTDNVDRDGERSVDLESKA